MGGGWELVRDVVQGLSPQAAGGQGQRLDLGVIAG